MASITQQIIGNLEEVYGRLGDAQLDTLKKLISEKPALRDYSEIEIWQPSTANLRQMIFVHQTCLKKVNTSWINSLKVVIVTRIFSLRIRTM